ncbi:MAG: bifunctional N-acetylglucosamine-1-phosphate uridyltransferase/glucosamine-1-phosphate acetyltransferase, partial [Planctomycetes bacterium]|nr:bifunctional N-acetylglucosamine-1-phosphate uridyltransferase/glucosamine-1-phosphate acetyltransferase [Planctomycetota bacterium]
MGILHPRGGWLVGDGSPKTNPSIHRETVVAGLVLAAGHGTRMRSRTPKVLHPVCGLPLLEYPLRALEAVGAIEAGVVIGAGAERVRAAFADRMVSGRSIRWALQDPPRGTGDAVRVGLERMLDDLPKGCALFILNGDLPLLSAHSLAEMLDQHRDTDAAMTLLTLELENPHGYGRIVRGPGGVADIVEEADADEATRAIHEVNGGVYLAEPHALSRALRDWIERDEGNVQGEVYFPPVARVLVEQGERVHAYELPVGRERELQQVNDRIEQSKAIAIRRAQIIEEHQRRGVTVVDPASTLIEEDVEIEADTVVQPFTVIRRGARIGRACEVGPFAHIREGTSMDEGSAIGNFTEIKNTSLGVGSKAKHLSYLGDGIVGAGVNIGAGTIFANYDGRRKSTTVVGDGAFVGSGTILVAPVEIGEHAQTGAGAVVTRGRDVPAHTTVVGIPARPLHGSGKQHGPSPHGPSPHGPSPHSPVEHSPVENGADEHSPDERRAEPRRSEEGERTDPAGAERD